MAKRTKLGLRMEEALKEAVAHRRGEIALDGRVVKPMRVGGGERLIAAGNAARGEEAFPAAIARRLARGEPPVKVFREWRGLTQQQLGTSSGVANQYISQLERGVRNAGRAVARKLAPALGVSMDALLD